MTYRVETWTLCQGWIDTWNEVFKTKQDAEDELDDFFNTCHDAYHKGYMQDKPNAEDYRITEDKDEEV